MGCSDPWKENERKKKVGPAREAFHSPVWLHPCFFSQNGEAHAKITYNG